MGKFERHIDEIEKLQKRIIERYKDNSFELQDVSQLFEFKMLHKDMISMHNIALKKIQIILDLTEKEYSKDDNNKVNWDYRSKEFWRSQIDFVFNKHEKPHKSSEIIESYPVNSNERRFCMSILSNVLAEYCAKGELKKYKIEGEKGYYYARPNMTLKKAD